MAYECAVKSTVAYLYSFKVDICFATCNRAFNWIKIEWYKTEAGLSSLFEAEAICWALLPFSQGLTERIYFSWGKKAAKRIQWQMAHLLKCVGWSPHLVPFLLSYSVYIYIILLFSKGLLSTYTIVFMVFIWTYFNSVKLFVRTTLQKCNCSSTAAWYLDIY